MDEKKPNWRPKKYEDREATAFSAGIPEHFRDTFKRFTKLSEIDLNEDFKKYCSVVEGEDIANKKQGKLSAYLRWIITKQVLQNMHKLK
jgi:hypothetical protein